MIIPVRCFSCSKVLANKYDWYIAESAKLKAATVETAKEGKDANEAITRASHFDPVHTGVLLDKLGLTRYCCRRHMIGQVDMTDTI